MAQETRDTARLSGVLLTQQQKLSEDNFKDVLLDQTPMPSKGTPGISLVSVQTSNALTLIGDFDDLARDQMLNQRKRINQLRMKVFRRVVRKDIRVVSAAKRLLLSVIKTNREVQLTRMPREHYSMEQCTLYAVELLRHIKLRKLAFDHVREGLENLYYLHDYFRNNDPPSAIYLASLIDQLIVALQEVTPLLEMMAKHKITDWEKVKSILGEKGVPAETRDLYNMTPSIQYFRAVRLLGGGGFGVVYRAAIGEVIECTLKLVPTTKFKMPKHACVDKVIASMVRNPFLVKYYATFATIECYVTVMEYIRGVDLHRILRRERILNEQQCRYVLAQIGDAVQHIHLRGFIHRDIKPSNMMVLPGLRTKLIDFDTVKICICSFLPRRSKFFSERSGREFIDTESAGTVPFFPPEVLAGNGYGRAIDWWAIGITAFNLAFGKVPYRGDKKDKEFRDKVANGPIPYPKDTECSAPFQSLINTLLEKKPARRMCSLIHHEWQIHPFFAGFDWKEIHNVQTSIDFEPIGHHMVLNDVGQWSTTGVKHHDKNHPLIENQLDSACQEPLYTYASSGFLVCLNKIRSEIALCTEDIVDPAEIFPDLSTAPPKYRFEPNTKKRIKEDILQLTPSQKPSSLK